MVVSIYYFPIKKRYWDIFMVKYLSISYPGVSDAIPPLEVEKTYFSPSYTLGHSSSRLEWVSLSAYLR